MYVNSKKPQEEHQVFKRRASGALSNRIAITK